MNINFDNFKKNKYLVLLSDSDKELKEFVEATFDNVIYFDSNVVQKEDVQQITDFINNNDYKVIFFDDNYWFRKIVVKLKKTINVNWVFKQTISALTSADVRASWACIMEYYDRRLVDKILFLDKDMYEVYKNAGFSCGRILLDVKTDKVKSSDSKLIGIISDDWNPNHNVYNQLSAITMVDYSYVKLNQFMDATQHFVKFFNVKNKDVKKINDIISDNMINLYINFTSTRYEFIIKSMDQGIPCIVGNTDIFDKYKTLKEYLVLKQDDNIGEIADKIKCAIANKDLIMNEYKKFRSDYSKQVKELLNTIISE